MQASFHGWEEVPKHGLSYNKVQAGERVEHVFFLIHVCQLHVYYLQLLEVVSFEIGFCKVGEPPPG